MTSREVTWELHGTDALDLLSSDWDDLNRGGAGLPILDAATMKLLCRHFGTGRERMAVCRSPSGVLAMGLLQLRGKGRWETFQPSQAPLGAWLQRPSQDLVPLLESLVRALPFPGLLLGITQQDPDIVPRPANTRNMQTLDYIETSRISVNSTFGDFWQARGSNLKQNLKKQRNRLAREGITARLEVVTAPANVGDAVDDFGLLESAGWKGEEGTALHPSNAQGRFYRGLFEHLSAAGEASVCRYFFGERLVASDLCVHRNGTVIILKTTFDEKEKAASPSMLLKQEFFELLFNDGRTKRIEFYGKVMDWHRRWTDEIRTLYHVNYLRWPWLARLRGSSEAV